MKHIYTTKNKYTQIALLVLLTGFVILVPLVGKAQTTELQVMVARMQAIMAQMEVLQQEFSALAAQVQGGGSPTVLGAQTSSVFTQSLEYGETNNDIKRIQKLLATDPEIYPYGVASGFFGPKTQEAIRNLQNRFGLDPVGVIGPATTALLSGYMQAYPDENYPDGVLSTKPRVLGVSTQTTPTTPSTPPVTTVATPGSNPASSIETWVEDDETWIDLRFKDGTRKRLAVDSEDEDEVVDFVAAKTVLTKEQVRALIEFDTRSSDSEEEDAEDALDDANDAIDDARDEIEEADDDGDDVDWAEDTLEEAEDLYDEAEEAYDDEDYDEAIDLAEEAEDLANEAVDRIDEEYEYDIDDIDEIIVYIGDGESEIMVFFEDGDDDEFTVNEDDEDDVVEEVADELDLDEDDVEDVIEFRGKRVEEIAVEIDDEDDKAYIDILFVDGDTKHYTLDETDEDDLIEMLANKLDLDEDDVEDVIEFD